MSDQSGGKGSKAWLGIVAMAGLAWGTYVPVVFYGGKELGGAAGGTEGARLTSILCVGLAYFVLAVLIPLGLFLTKKHAWPPLKPTGLAFSCLAGMVPFALSSPPRQRLMRPRPPGWRLVATAC